MKAEVLEKVLETGAVAGQIGAGVGRMKEVVAGAIDDGIESAKRTSKRGRRAAEDFLDDAKYQLKQHPFETVAISFGIGLGLGAIAGVLLAPKRGR